MVKKKYNKNSNCNKATKKLSSVVRKLRKIICAKTKKKIMKKLRKIQL